MFEQLAAECGFPKMLFQNIADAADRHYSPHQYHNKEHAYRVCDIALNLAMSDSQTAQHSMPILSVGLAARWHDAIYVPRAQGDANEQCSAAQLLLDADLVSLSDPWGDFVDTQAAIAAEQEPFHDQEASKTFLSKFLTVRQTIYRTERAIAMYEDQARDNIKRWCGIKG